MTLIMVCLAIIGLCVAAITICVAANCHHGLGTSGTEQEDCPPGSACSGGRVGERTAGDAAWKDREEGSVMQCDRCGAGVEVVCSDCGKHYDDNPIRYLGIRHLPASHLREHETAMDRPATLRRSMRPSDWDGKTKENQHEAHLSSAPSRSARRCGSRDAPEPGPMSAAAYVGKMAHGILTRSGEEVEPGAVAWDDVTRNRQGSAHPSERPRGPRRSPHRRKPTSSSSRTESRHPRGSRRH